MDCVYCGNKKDCWFLDREPDFPCRDEKEPVMFENKKKSSHERGSGEKSGD